ncbi:MAG: methyl-accepting chemotaxis protein [Sulfuricella sp.]|nr:methyl-accepting chemotaxis protein [Sulfuricella sp.]
MPLNFKIRTQLFIFLAGAILIFGAALGVALHGMNQAQNRFSAFIEGDLAQQVAFSDMYAQGLQMGQAIRNIQLDPANKKAYDNLNKAAADFEAALSKARQLSVANPVQTEALNRIGELRNKQKAAQDAILAAVAGNDLAAAIAKTNKEETPVWREMKQVILDTQKNISEGTLRSKDEMLQSVKNGERLSSIVTILGILGGIAIALVIAANIARQFALFTGHLRQLSGGDLTQRIEIHDCSELAEAASAFNHFMDGLQKIVKTIKSDAELVSADVTRLSASAREVAESARGQGQAVNDTASAVEEMTRNIDQVSNNAAAAKDIADQATRLSAKGESLIGEATAEMSLIAKTVLDSSQSIQSLKHLSERISGIVNVIRDIADQTNLLALNAAIEAARAGEQGRGFAVVADEVRKLAERTGVATSEIKSMIETIQNETQSAVTSMETGSQQVERGVNKVSQLVEPLQELHNGATITLDSLVELASATRAQSTASGAISNNVERIADMATRNNNIMEETTEAARHLEGLASSLMNTVRQFQV